MKSAVHCSTRSGPRWLEHFFLSRGWLALAPVARPTFSLVKAAQPLPIFPCPRSDPGNKNFAKERATTKGRAQILTAFNRVGQK